MCDFGCCSVMRGCVTYTYVNQPQNTIYTGSVVQANNAALATANHEVVNDGKKQLLLLLQYFST